MCQTLCPSLSTLYTSTRDQGFLMIVVSRPSTMTWRIHRSLFHTTLGHMWKQSLSWWVLWKEKNVHSIRVIHKLKHIKPWVWSQTLSSWELHKVSQVSLLLNLPRTKIGVGLLKIGFLARPIEMGWAKLALYKLIRDLGQHVPSIHPILNPKILLKFGEKEGPKTFTQLSRYHLIGNELMSS